MANMLFANNCNTTLSGSLTNVATTMSVTSATGFPSPTGSQYFYCTLADAATQTTIEIVKVTAVSGTTFTIVRGQDGTSGTAFASGAVVSLRLVRANLNDFPKLDETNSFSQNQTFAGFSNTATSNFNGTAATGFLATYGTGTTTSYIYHKLLNNGSSLFLGLEGSVGGSLLTGSSAYAVVLSNPNYNTPIQFGVNNILVAQFGAGVSIGNTTDPGAGNLRFNTTNTNGIYFGSSSLLSDYETGTWTPNQGSGLVIVGTFASQGTYTKVGRLVTVSFNITATAVSYASGGAVICTNLPYATLSGTSSFIGSGINANNTVGFQVTPYISTVYGAQAVASTSGIYMTVTYYTA